jgi:hypothetical protein
MKRVLALTLVLALVSTLAVAVTLFADNEKPDTIKLSREPLSSMFDGSVTDELTGRPVEGAHCTLLDTGGAAGMITWGNLPKSMKVAETRTNSYGRFTFERSSSTYGTILIEKEGYGRVAKVDVDLRQTFRCPLSPAAIVRGIATDPGGQPVAKAGMTINSLRSRVCFGAVSSGADGSFTFKDLAPDTYIIQQQEGDRYTRINCVTVGAGQEYTVDWNAPGKATVEGRVTLRAKPIEGAHVVVHPAGGGMYVGFCDTDDKGRYKISIPEPGKYLFTSYQGEWTGQDRMYVRSVVTIKPGMNRFEMQFPGASLTGYVVDAKGRPIPNLPLRLLHRRTEQDTFGGYDWFSQHTKPFWWPEMAARTDKTGAFSIDNLSSGQWLLTAQLDDLHTIPLGAPVWLRQDRNKQSPLAKLPQLGTAQVVVADSKTGKPLSGATVSCVDAYGVIYYPRPTNSTMEATALGIRSAKPGQYTFDKLAPGHYKAISKSAIYPTASLPFDVKPGKVTKANVKLIKSQRIVFSLRESDSDAMPGLPWVGFKLTKVGSATPVLEDAHGPYWGDAMFLQGDSPRQGGVPVPPGRYMLKAVLRRENTPGVISARDDLWSTIRTVTVLPGKDLVVEIPWTKYSGTQPSIRTTGIPDSVAK